MPSELVPVMRFATAPEAELARNALAEAGIQALLEGDQTVAMAWHLSNAVGGIKLLVAFPYAARARKLLEGSAAGAQGGPSSLIPLSWMDYYLIPARAFWATSRT